MPPKRFAAIHRRGATGIRRRTATGGGHRFRRLSRIRRGFRGKPARRIRPVPALRRYTGRKRSGGRPMRPGNRRHWAWSGGRSTDGGGYPPIVNSPNPLVSVIVPAMNERRTIAAVIANARAVHPETEVIVVANGSSDGTDEIARRMGARVSVFPRPLGHDVGRSIGARLAKGAILLFTDGDIVIPTEKLRPFVDAVRQGSDVALNRYNGRTLTKHPHPVVIAKHALNAALRRRDLAGSSMTTIPHAISRRMLEKVGASALSVPPLALVSAVRHGLSVSRAAYVEVGRSNPVRRRGRREDPLKRLIIGDHVEAMGRMLQEQGPRGGYTDLLRQRNKVR